MYFLPLTMFLNLIHVQICLIIRRYHVFTRQQGNADMSSRSHFSDPWIWFHLLNSHRCLLAYCPFNREGVSRMKMVIDCYSSVEIKWNEMWSDCFCETGVWLMHEQWAKENPQRQRQQKRTQRKRRHLLDCWRNSWNVLLYSVKTLQDSPRMRVSL